MLDIYTSTFFLWAAGAFLVGLAIIGGIQLFIDHAWTALPLFIFLSPLYMVFGLGYAAWRSRNDIILRLGWTMVVIFLSASGISYLMGD